MRTFLFKMFSCFLTLTTPKGQNRILTSALCSALMSPVLCSHLVQNSILVVGDYEKLWAAVTGGRGTGRGKKKGKPKDKESLPTGFGTENFHFHKTRKKCYNAKK